MREILFRGKSPASGLWIIGDLRQYPSGAKAIKANDMLHIMEVVPDTVGQFTGLTDKNGKKIFEGDVLRYYSDYMREFMGDLCIARYGEFNCSCCDGVYGLVFEGGDIREHDSYVVIGNIHDNPELMEGERHG